LAAEGINFGFDCAKIELEKLICPDFEQGKLNSNQNSVFDKNNNVFGKIKV